MLLVGHSRLWAAFDRPSSQTSQRPANALQKGPGHGVHRSLEERHAEDVGIRLADDGQDLLYVTVDREASRSTLGYTFSGLDTV